MKRQLIFSPNSAFRNDYAPNYSVCVEAGGVVKLTDLLASSQVLEEPLRVLVFFNDYRQTGGERNSVNTLHRFLEAKNKNHRLISFTNQTLASGGLTQKVNTVLGTGSLLHRIRREISDFRPDLIHVENQFPTIGPALARVLGETGIPYVETLRNFRASCIAGTHYRLGDSCHKCAINRRTLHPILYKCYRDDRLQTIGALTSRKLGTSLNSGPSRVMIFTSAYMRDFYRDLPGAKNSVIIPNAVSPEVFSENLGQTRLYGFSFVGRLEPDKGIELFLRLAEEFPKVRVGIAGEGSLENRVLVAARSFSNLHYKGNLSPKATYALMRNSRIVVVPSAFEEPFGRVAVEAAACGAVPVVSDRGALPEIGKLISLPTEALSPKEVKPWQEAVRRILRLPQIELDQLQHRLNLNTRENFSLEIVAKKTQRAYELALSADR